MDANQTRFERHLQQKMQDVLCSLKHHGGRIAVETSADEFEQVTLMDERELATLAIDRDTRLLREIRAAQLRLRERTFGICQDCERQIPDRRLEALPWARRCVRCQEKEDLRSGDSPPRVSFAA